MKLLRLALVTIERSPIPAGKSLRASYGGIDVETRDTRSSGLPGPVLVMASTVLSKRPQLNAAHEVVAEEGMRKSLEQAIVLIADLMSVATRSSRSISSLTPWVALTELTAEDRDYLVDAVGFESPMLAARNRIRVWPHPMRPDASTSTSGCLSERSRSPRGRWLGRSPAFWAGLRRSTTRGRRSGTGSRGSAIWPRMPTAVWSL
jgi:hypothetical protein